MPECFKPISYIHFQILDMAISFRKLILGKQNLSLESSLENKLKALLWRNLSCEETLLTWFEKVEIQFFQKFNFGRAEKDVKN